MKILALVGTRSGSNWLGSKLEAAGAAVPPGRYPPNSWNPQWVEGHALNRIACALLGTEPHFFLARHARPGAAPAEPVLWELEGWLRAHARAAAPRTLLVKWGALPWLWPWVEPMVADRSVGLVVARRDRAARVASLVRIHAEYRPRRTAEHAEEFFCRHDAGVELLVNDFRSSGRPVWEVDFGGAVPGDCAAWVRGPG